MASHVPFLAVRPDDQFSAEYKPNAVDPSDSPASPLLEHARPTINMSRVPGVVQLLLVCVLNFGLSTLVRSSTAGISGYQYASASKDVTESWQVGALVGWKLVGLVGSWYAGFGYRDIAVLTLLINQPYHYLLYSFWGLELIPVLISLTTDVICAALSFALFRPSTSAADVGKINTSNQIVARDWQIDALTSLLAATIYAVTFYLSYFGNLGAFLIIHFDNIPSLERAHDASIPSLLQSFAVSGICAMLFLFRPAFAAAGRAALTEPKTRPRRVRRFNPETATLAETFAHNLGYGESGLSPRAEVLAIRVLVLAFGTLAQTFVRVFGTVQGTDIVGSLGYAGLWTAAHVGVGVAYAWLSNEY